MESADILEMVQSITFVIFFLGIAYILAKYM